MRRKDLKKSMLEYCKIILEKMSFSRRLFRKEYKKTFAYLAPAEHEELKRWLRASGKQEGGQGV
ncbi:hypothetical protein [Chryseolinea soli]|uniref:Uncharacterized protein n=1 Tax=Chryseolinea soli TaxID=2321403 RepID=A0A385SSA3_9BACT|nr:hypothetical protein [Chryseolinea soli]AYB32865.1 hypothetical protein D4L85_20785 [Chryseolinea soli]